MRVLLLQLLLNKYCTTRTYISMDGYYYTRLQVINAYSAKIDDNFTCLMRQRSTSKTRFYLLRPDWTAPYDQIIRIYDLIANFFPSNLSPQTCVPEDCETSCIRSPSRLTARTSYHVICKYSDNILFLLIAYFLPNCSLQIKLILFGLQLSPEKSKGAEVMAKEKPPHVIYINCKMYAMMTYGYNKRDLYVSQLIIHFLQYFTFNCVISGRR